jgi:hypothetical protein
MQQDVDVKDCGKENHNFELKYLWGGPKNIKREII